MTTESHHKADTPDNGNNPAVRLVVPASIRLRSSWPILLVAILFVVGAFLTWYFTWFGRELSNADISSYLADFQHPRKVQHALLQIQQRIESGDASAKQWYPQLLELANNPEPELRLTVAWLMGFDSKAPAFHTTLLKLLADPQPLVRRNAALALVRFGDSSGRPELRSIFEPYQVRAPAEGVLNSSLKTGSEVSRGTLLARLQGEKEMMELRAPIPGKVATIIVQSGAHVAENEPVMTLVSDEDSVWEALRGLALIGEREDLETVQRYLKTSTVSDRIKDQAALTIKSIQSRLN